MTRFPDWAMRFDAYMSQRLAAPFVWGSNDCVLFAAGAVLAITGVDVVKGRARYRTARGAAVAVRRLGGLVGIATGALGAPCSPTDVRQGDVLLMPQAEREMLAVCVDDARVVAPGRDGVMFLPRSLALLAWRAG